MIQNTDYTSNLGCTNNYQYHRIAVAEESEQSDACTCAAYVGVYAETIISACTTQEKTKKYIEVLKQEGAFFESNLAGTTPAKLRLHLLDEIIKT